MLRQRREWKNGQSLRVHARAPRADPGRFVGKIALNGIMRGAMHGAYLGYWMDVDHQNGGLCTEGIRAVLDFAFGPARSIACRPRSCRTTRRASASSRSSASAARVTPSATLQIAGKWEDHILFARTREEHPAPGSRHDDAVA